MQLEAAGRLWVFTQSQLVPYVRLPHGLILASSWRGGFRAAVDCVQSGLPCECCHSQRRSHIIFNGLAPETPQLLFGHILLVMSSSRSMHTRGDTHPSDGGVARLQKSLWGRRYCCGHLWALGHTPGYESNHLGLLSSTGKNFCNFRTAKASFCI